MPRAKVRDIEVAAMEVCAVALKRKWKRKGATYSYYVRLDKHQIKRILNYLDVRFC
jgi:hypothetical protein